MMHNQKVILSGCQALRIGRKCFLFCKLEQLDIVSSSTVADKLFQVHFLRFECESSRKKASSNLEKDRIIREKAHIEGCPIVTNNFFSGWANIK
jgi:hypothetical protein